MVTVTFMNETTVEPLRDLVEETLLQLLRLNPDTPMAEPEQWIRRLKVTGASYADDQGPMGQAAAEVMVACKHLTGNDLTGARIALISARRYLSPAPAHHAADG
jgi:hypothetical protein